MDREINILEYLPYFLQEIDEYVEVTKVENPEISDLWTQLSTVQNEFYLEDSTEYAVKRWEKILEIKPADTDTLDERKFRIVMRLSQQIPYTYASLEEALITLCGPRGYTLEVNPVACTISVRVTLGVKFMFDEVKKLLDRVLPCNLLLDFRLLYNRHMDLKKYTQAQMHTMTHKTIKEEVLA